MALDDDIRVLSGVALFESLTQEQIRLLAFGAETMRLLKGRELFREGAVADNAFVVSSGSIALYRERGGKRVNVGHAKPGTILSEFALIAQTRRLHSAIAESDSEVIRLNRTLFRRILEEYPEVAAALYKRIAEDFEKMARRIGMMESKFR